MSKKDKALELADFLGGDFAEKYQKTLQENVKVSTKLSAILWMFESYYDVFSQNNRELVRLVDEATTGKFADDAEHMKQIKQTSKNKLNRIKNKEVRFAKFYKEFSGDFTTYFAGKDSEAADAVLDAFDAFWDNVVNVDERNVSVKQDFTFDEQTSTDRMAAIGQNGNTGEHYKTIK